MASPIFFFLFYYIRTNLTFLTLIILALACGYILLYFPTLFSAQSSGSEHSFQENELDWSLDEIKTASKTPIENCTLTMYSRTYFRGISVHVGKNIWDFGTFDDQLASLKIEGNCCWELFTGEKFRNDYRRDSLKLSQGNYGSSTQIKEVFKRASSARQLKTC